MSLFPASSIPAGATGYDIDNSLRFNDNDSAYLSWTPTTASNRKTWTWSGWVKRGNIGTDQHIFNTYTGTGAVNTSFLFEGDAFLFYDYEGGGGPGYQFNLTTSRLFRDASAWYHIVVQLDTTQATASDRAKIYINGTQETSFSTADYPTLNYNGGHINDAVEHTIGTHNGALYLDGYLAEVHFIDGTALDPTSFGETGDYGEWKPKEVTGVTYGTNGFYLNFKGGGIIAATGGTITTDGNYKVHTFTADGTFTPSSVAGDGYVEYLVIAGGGGGGSNSGGDEGGGGGGAGGYLTDFTTVTASAYSITVGDGGLGRANGAGAGGDGGNSVFSTITSTGGGGGGATDSDTARSGGSGGGMGSNSAYTAGAATSGQGYGGGTGEGWHGAGGGGAGQVGGDYNPPSSVNGDGGNGGNGLASSITGSSVTRAGGGGGGTWNSSSYTGQIPGTGGSGGGGAGGATNQGVGSAGTVNTGAGGGGAGNNLASGAGGSGVVIIRYQFQ